MLLMLMIKLLLLLLLLHELVFVVFAKTLKERWEETSGEVVLLFLMIRLLLLVLRIFAGKRQEVRLCC